MEISLTQGKVAIVDEVDFEYLNQWKWYLHKSGYAVRNQTTPNGKRRTVLMHRVIANTPEDMNTDHANGDKLDNRRNNLRLATFSQNAMNRKVYVTNMLGVKGVRYEQYSYKSKTPRVNPYLATIKVNGKNIYLGSFKTAEEASTAYKQAAKKYFGEFGRTI